MFELKKLNVHKIVETEKQKDKLLNNGLKEVIKKVVAEVKVAAKKGKA